MTTDLSFYLLSKFSLVQQSMLVLIISSSHMFGIHLRVRFAIFSFLDNMTSWKQLRMSLHLMNMASYYILVNSFFHCQCGISAIIDDTHSFYLTTDKISHQFLQIDQENVLTFPHFSSQLRFLHQVTTDLLKSSKGWKSPKCARKYVSRKEVFTISVGDVTLKYKCRAITVTQQWCLLISAMFVRNLFLPKEILLLEWRLYKTKNQKDSRRTVKL